MVWAINTRVGDHGLKVLLISICNYADDQWKCWPKVETLAHDTECSKRTIQRALTKLSELGLIQVEPRFDSKGKQIQSMIYLKRGEGDNLSPLPVGGDKNGQKGPGWVTELCRGEGDTTLSPLNEPSIEPSKIEPSKKDSIPSLSLRDEAERFFVDQFWPAFPKRFGSNPKEPAKKKIVALILKGEKPEEILSGVQRLYSAMQRSDKIGTEFVPMALTWINRKQWRDDPMPAGNSSANKPTSFFEIAAGKW